MSNFPKPNFFGKICLPSKWDNIDDGILTRHFIYINLALGVVILPDQIYQQGQYG